MKGKSRFNRDKFSCNNSSLLTDPQALVKVVLMSVTYSCDICGKNILNSMDSVRVTGGKDYFIFCENCWEESKENLELKKETSSVNQN